VTVKGVIAGSVPWRRAKSGHSLFGELAELARPDRVQNAAKGRIAPRSIPAENTRRPDLGGACR